MVQRYPSGVNWLKVNVENPTDPPLDKGTGSRFVLSSLPEKGRFTMISPYD